MSIEPDPHALTGDDEPEDAWDRNDPPHELLDNLRRRLVLLDITPAPRNRVRFAHLVEDLIWLAERLRERDED